MRLVNLGPAQTGLSGPGQGLCLRLSFCSSPGSICPICSPSLPNASDHLRLTPLSILPKGDHPYPTSDATWECVWRKARQGFFLQRKANLRVREAGPWAHLSLVPGLTSPNASGRQQPFSQGLEILTSQECKASAQEACVWWQNTSGLPGGWDSMNYELLKATCVYGLGAMLKSCQLFQLLCVHYRKGECSSRKCICWGCCLDGSGRHLLKPQVLRLGQQSATAAWQGPEWRAVGF